MCLRSSYPFYIVSYYIKWVTPSWTHSMTWLSVTVFHLSICMILVFLRCSFRSQWPWGANLNLDFQWLFEREPLELLDVMKVSLKINSIIIIHFFLSLWPKKATLFCCNGFEVFVFPCLIYVDWHWYLGTGPTGTHTIIMQREAVNDLHVMKQKQTIRCCWWVVIYKKKVGHTELL